MKPSFKVKKGVLLKKVTNKFCYFKNMSLTTRKPASHDSINDLRHG